MQQYAPLGVALRAACTSIPQRLARLHSTPLCVALIYMANGGGAIRTCVVRVQHATRARSTCPFFLGAFGEGQEPAGPCGPTGLLMPPRGARHSFTIVHILPARRPNAFVRTRTCVAILAPAFVSRRTSTYLASSCGWALRGRLWPPP